jgi:hypothetical protein
MTASRTQHTATLLSNGKVLLTGGATYAPNQYAVGVLPTAELFDPATGTFARTGTMSVARRLHSATLLPDGRVLILGGYDTGRPLDNAELYDPETGTFTAAGRLLFPRAGHDAILLRDGTVLIVGGTDGRYPAIPDAEIYDPVAGTFTATGPYVGRGACDFCAQSVLLADGRVLFPGQLPAQLYDPRTRVFSPTGQPTGVRSAATVLLNGRVLFAGGESDMLGRSKEAELFDPTRGVFAQTSGMTWRRVWHSLTLLPDGTVLAAGGETDNCGPGWCEFGGTTTTAEAYDPVTGSFAVVGSMGESRSGHTATLLNDGRVLIAGGVAYGGIGAFYGSTAGAELYTPRTLVGVPEVIEAPAEVSEGSVVAIFTTPFAAGSVIPPTVTIGGRLADVLWFGRLRDMRRAGTVFVRIPRGLASGPVVLRMSYLGRSSHAVTLVVR